MRDLGKKFPFVNIGNQSKINKMIMDIEKENLERIETLEKKVQRYSVLLDKITEELMKITDATKTKDN